VATVRSGLEQFVASPPKEFANKRLGLLANPASVNCRFEHARDLIAGRFPGRLKALFSPQHGFFAEKQDNMIESAHGSDPVLGIPVFSLYGETRSPTAEMLEQIDTLIIDLQDVGTRVYTFAYTVANCLEAAKQHQIKVVILDRPNPIGGVAIEGNILNPEYTSFVGRFEIPMRHGLTMGELALLFNEQWQIGCELTIIPMTGWRREMYFDNTGLPWVAPSPNLPTPTSAMVYPGQVIWEATNVSEGRGTCQPFELFGAPYLDEAALLQSIAARQPGMHLRPTIFEPTFNKWAGEACRGFQIHVTDRQAYRPYRSTLAWLQWIYHHHGNDFKYKLPPYEYEYHKLPIDLVLGNRALREQIEQKNPIVEIEAAWQTELTLFESLRDKFLCYN
jgi:uncharacterized protein YbbC (DUF1343 family)